MKPEYMHALVIDQHSGELPPEVAELLEAYLASNPAARKEAAQIVEALQLASETVARHPECVRVFPREAPQPVREVRRRWAAPPWLKVAAAVVFSALTAVGGFYAGSARPAHSPASSFVASLASTTPRKDSPWAQYRMSIDPLAGGMQMVRVEFTGKGARP